ncbi:MAG: DNA polymerase I [Candidatus Microsaccharimonas sossegonensis]|uniref:DNA-directed DNA polymerase n=1 Tax=Candidatus Microsaccharimonas sossegonensis TaxID=2506948 RepID=A0A4Q0AHF1_9BACT|nr:MAG: DNA polymerase I [Candidatus Microsaccharimonas sossegonensis]
MKRLAVIDGKSVFYRGYYAMPGLSLPDGTPTGGVFGFISIAIELIKKLEPDYVAVAWDIKGTSAAKRLEIFDGYKLGRTKPQEDFYAQLPILREVLEAFNWPLYELDRYEADDIMGTFAAQAKKEGVEACLVTGDYDLLQLIDDNTGVYITRTGSTDLVRYDAAAFEAKYGIKVNQFIDYKALVGDSSDNIPGVSNIGPKAAQMLLTTYGDLDGIYAHTNDLKGAQQKNIVAGKNAAYMSQKLARIFTDAPIKIDWNAANIERTQVDKVIEVLRKYQFNSLVGRLPRHMKIGDKVIDVEAAGEVSEEKAEIVSLEVVKWPDNLRIDGPVLIDVIDDALWVSTDKNTIATKPVVEVDTSVWTALGMATVVSYDVKDVYHKLAALGVFPRFSNVHDIRQGAFLIDPLRRDRSAHALIGMEAPEPTQLLAGLWIVYGSQVAFFKKVPKLARIAQELDFPLTYILFRIEHKGVLVDPMVLHKMSDELGSEHQKLEQEMCSMVGYEFNIGSPAQLSEVLFTKLQLPTAGIKKGKTGYSTGQAELDKLRGQHPIIELIEQTRELAKLKNTYTDSLPKLADVHHRIHTTFNQDVASTGRLSSSNPNLQNIPIRTELGRKIREAFIADGDKVLVSADYSQFELRLAAILANDKKLINDFNGDVDIHTKTASEVYGIPMGEVTKHQRRDAKVINFGVLYGMSPHGLAAQTGMSFGQAKEFIEQYFKLREPIRRFIDDTLTKARTEGYVETYFGRRRPTPDIKSSNFMVRAGAERAAANMPIQGTEADLMKLAMIRVDEKLGDLGDQVLQIHDSILVECPEKNADKVANILKTTMEEIAPELGISLRVDVSSGKNWGDL